MKVLERFCLFRNLILVQKYIVVILKIYSVSMEVLYYFEFVNYLLKRRVTFNSELWVTETGRLFFASSVY